MIIFKMSHRNTRNCLEIKALLYKCKENRSKFNRFLCKNKQQQFPQMYQLKLLGKRGMNFPKHLTAEVDKAMADQQSREKLFLRYTIIEFIYSSPSRTGGFREGDWGPNSYMGRRGNMNGRCVWQKPCVGGFPPHRRIHK